MVTQRDTIEEIKTNIRKLEDYYQVVHFISEMMHNLGGAQPAKAVGDAENPGASEPLMDSSLQFIAGTVKMKEMEQKEISSKSLLANVLDIDDNFRSSTLPHSNHPSHVKPPFPNGCSVLR